MSDGDLERLAPIIERALDVLVDEMRETLADLDAADFPLDSPEGRLVAGVRRAIAAWDEARAVTSGFRPTCPRCWEKCPPGSTRCRRDGTWLLFDPPPSAAEEEEERIAEIERDVFGPDDLALEAVA